MAVVLVTGGSGFLGSWVLRHLVDQGHRCVVFDQQKNSARWDILLGERQARVTFEEGDIADSEAVGVVLDKHTVEAVIHLGALLTPECQEDPLQGCRVNVLGMVSLFEQVRLRREQIPRISWASSLAVFGPIPESKLRTEVIDETHAPSFYGAFKRSAELIARQYWKHYRVSSLGIRPHVIYGPERTEGLTAGASLAARAIARGESASINYSGMCGYDYVEDVARAMIRAAFEGPVGAHVVDLHSEQARPADLVTLLKDIDRNAQVDWAGPHIPSNKPPRDTPISRIFTDWETTGLRQGLERTIAFYRTGDGNNISRQ